MEARDSHYYRTLYRVAVTINSTLDTREVLKAIAQLTTTALHAKACSIMLLSPDRLQLLHSAAYGLSDWYMRKGPVKVDLSIAEALSGRPIVIRDAGTDERVQYRPQAVQEGIASILCVPIRLRDNVVGVMRVYSSLLREFAVDEIGFVEAIAHLGAIALENAHRYEEMKYNYDAVQQDLLEWYSAWGIERSADALVGSKSE